MAGSSMPPDGWFADAELLRDLAKWAKAHLPREAGDLEELAKDIAQDVVMRGIAERRAGRGPVDTREDVRRWCFGVVKNRVKEELRRVGKSERLADDDAPDVPAADVHEVGETLVKRDKYADAAERALAENPEHAENIRMAHDQAEGKRSLKEAAAAQGVDYAVMRQRVTRSRQVVAAAVMALVAAAAIFAAWGRRPQITPDDHLAHKDEPSPQYKQALALRDEALPLCARGDRAPCREKLQRAIALEPAIGRDPLVQQALSAASPDAGPPDAAPPDAMLEDVRRTIRDWNAAMNRHDLQALKPLYAEDVSYYDRWDPTIPRARVLDAKRAMFGPASAYSQDVLGEVAVRPGDIMASRVAVFRMNATVAGVTKVTTVTVTLERELDGRFAISKETNEEGLRSKADWQLHCLTAASEAVRAVSEVQAFYAQAAKDTKTAEGEYPRLTEMDREDLPGERFERVTGYGTETRLLPSPRVDYVVDRKTGRVDVKVSGKPVAVPAGAFAEIAAACAAPNKSEGRW
jgi:DNA-directed RNA polymerase specialized sigma24 family protein/ketosteroid isomerase-like protein